MHASMHVCAFLHGLFMYFNILYFSIFQYMSILAMLFEPHVSLSFVDVSHACQEIDFALTRSQAVEHTSYPAVGEVTAMPLKMPAVLERPLGSLLFFHAFRKRKSLLRDESRQFRPRLLARGPL